MIPEKNHKKLIQKKHIYISYIQKQILQKRYILYITKYNRGR